MFHARHPETCPTLAMTRHESLKSLQCGTCYRSIMTTFQLKDIHTVVLKAP